MTWWLRIRWPLVFITAILCMFVVDWYWRIPAEWAEIRELRAQWDEDDHEMFLSMVVVKHESCGRTFVRKLLRRLDPAGFVLPVTRATFEGSLGDKVQAMQEGETRLLDDVARPALAEDDFEPGSYELEVVLLCEQAAEGGETEKLRAAEDKNARLPTSPYLKASLPARVTIHMSGKRS